MSKPQQIQLDGGKVITLQMTTNAAVFISEMLAAQRYGDMVNAGQEHLLPDITIQISTQHGVAIPSAAPTAPAGPAVSV